MQELGPGYTYEHIFADNSSTDETVSLLRREATINSNIKLIVNSRNVGPFRNMWNALRSATGELVIPLIPADLQDPPALIPEFIAKWEAGFKVVYGVRKNRQESILMRSLRSIYYKVIQKFAHFYIPQDAGEFMALDKEIVNSLLLTKDEYPYIRGLVAQMDARSSYVEYTWEKRFAGKSKNNFIDLIDQAMNGLISTSRIPARLALLAGFILSGVGIVAACILVLVLSFHRGGLQLGIPTIIVSLSFFSGVQLLFLGLIGEYVLSIHNQIRPGPPMREIERVNFDD